jgi:hypothetical protein
MNDTKETDKGRFLNSEIRYIVDHIDEYSQVDIINFCSLIVNITKNESFSNKLKNRGFTQEFIDKFLKLANLEIRK